MNINNKKISNGVIIWVAIALVVVLGLIWYFSNQPRPALSPTTFQGSIQAVAVNTYTNTKGQKWGPLPQGIVTYNVTSADDVYPKFVSGVIDPLDVRLGQVQKMTIVVNDTADISSLVAQIETDKGTETVPLNRTSVNAVTQDDLMNRQYFVHNGILNILDASNKQYAIPDDIKPLLASNIPASLLNTAMAQSAVLQKFTYEGEWTAHDTHVTTYHTTFVAKDAAGRTNQLVMVWSDNACGLPNYGTGAQPLGSACTLPTGVSGWDGGDITVSANVVVQSATEFAWAPGNKIIISTSPAGSFTSLNSGGKIKKEYLFYPDNDKDGYAANAGLIPSQNSTSSSATRMSAMTNDPTVAGNLDCYDSNANAHPGQTIWFTTDRGDGSYDYDCSSGSTPETLSGTGSMPGVGRCDTNSGYACDNIYPNGVNGFQSATACGSVGTYITNSGGSFCSSGYSCTTTSTVANCSNPPTYEYGTSIGQCDNNSSQPCDPLYPNGKTGWVSSVPGVGLSGTYISNAGLFCAVPQQACVQGTVTQAVH